MSFNTAEGRAEYTALNGQTDFTFVFKVYADTDLVVWLTPNGDVPDDTNDLLVLGTHYSVVINGDNGGTLTLSTPAAAGDKLTFIRRLAALRDVEYTHNGDLSSDVLNLDQNYQTYLIGDTLSALGKAVRVPDSSQGIDGTLPAPYPDAYIKWNSAGNALENDSNLSDQLKLAIEAAWDSEAARLTSLSIATEFVDGAGGSNEFVKLYTSNKDGTYTVTPQANVFSAKWYEFQAMGSAKTATDAATSVIQGLREDYNYVSTQGQTTFTQHYNVGLVDVYVEGIKLVPVVDFVATDGQNVMLNTPLDANKEVEIIAQGIATYPDFLIREW